MTIESWLKYALEPSDQKYPWSSGVLARIASRDLGRPVTREEIEAACPFPVAKQVYSGVLYLARATRLRQQYEYNALMLAAQITHPLVAIAAYDDAPETHFAVSQWVRSLAPCKTKRSETTLRDWCRVLTGVTMDPQAFRGALLAAGIRPVDAGCHTWWFSYRLTKRAWEDYIRESS